MKKLFNSFKSFLTTKKGKITVIVGVIVIAVLALLTTVLLTVNKDTTPEKLEVKDNLTLEVGVDKLPQIKDYFVEFKETGENGFKVTYEEISDVVLPEGVEEQEVNQNEPKVNEDGTLGSVAKFKVSLSDEYHTYETELEIVDTTAPKLTVKDVEITEGNELKADNFFEKCEDNSGSACLALETKEDLPNTVGEHEVELFTKDVHENETSAKAKLVIKAKLVEEKKPATGGNSGTTTKPNPSKPSGGNNTKPSGGGSTGGNTSGGNSGGSTNTCDSTPAAGSITTHMTVVIPCANHGDYNVAQQYKNKASEITGAETRAIIYDPAFTDHGVNQSFASIYAITNSKGQTIGYSAFITVMKNDGESIYSDKEVGKYVLGSNGQKHWVYKNF